MKVKVEFESHDEYDDMVKDLSALVHEAMTKSVRHCDVTLAKLLKILLEAEIVEP
jgi:hypothetical protein